MSRKAGKIILTSEAIGKTAHTRESRATLPIGLEGRIGLLRVPRAIGDAATGPYGLKYHSSIYSREPQEAPALLAVGGKRNRAREKSYSRDGVMHTPTAHPLEPTLQLVYNNVELMTKFELYDHIQNTDHISTWVSTSMKKTARNNCLHTPGTSWHQSAKQKSGWQRWNQYSRT